MQLARSGALRHIAVLPLCALLVGGYAGNAACAGEDDGQSAPPAPVAERTAAGESNPDGAAPTPILDPAHVAGAIERAVAYVDRVADENPQAFHAMDVLYRMYAIEAFADAPQRLHRYMEESTDREAVAFARIFGRLVAVTQMDSGGQGWVEYAPTMIAKGGLNLITIPALYCDQLEFPPCYDTTLKAGAAAGGYFVTHVGLALMWIRENGCAAPVPEDFEASVIEGIAAIPNTNENVTDLEIEAASTLYYMGRGDLVSPSFLRVMLDVQREDGGWGMRSPSADSNWHPTFMAIWTLMEAGEPGLAKGPMVPQKCSFRQRVAGECSEP
jgi:hypothetical protein